MAKLYRLKYEDDNEKDEKEQTDFPSNKSSNILNYMNDRFDFKASSNVAILIPLSFLIVLYAYILAAIPSYSDQEQIFQQDLKKEILAKLEGESVANQVVIAKSYIDNINNIVGIYIETDGISIKIGEVMNKSRNVWFSTDYEKNKFFELLEGLLYIVLMLIVSYVTFLQKSSASPQGKGDE